MSLPPISSERASLQVWDLLPRPYRGSRAILAGVLVTALISALCAAIDRWLPAHGVAMFYLLAVVSCAVGFGLLAGLAAATASFLAYNFLFVQPTYTLTISDPRDLFSLLIFFAVATASASLAGRLREVAEQARRRSTSLEALNMLATKLSACTSPGQVIEALLSETSKLSGQRAIFLSATVNGLQPPSDETENSGLNTADWQAAQRCHASREKVYPVAAGWQGSHYEFRPVIANNAVSGVLGIHQLSFDEANDAAVDAMLQQTAVALDRLSLQTAKIAAEKQAESERLRATLLSSVSHDIKTPLAAIQGAVTSLRQLGAKMPEDSRSELLATIEEEAAYLSRFITNMLDMMRLQSGPPELQKNGVDLADTLGAAVAHARKLSPGIQIRLDVRVTPALVRGDEVLLERAFLNVLENATNASPSGALIKAVLQSASRQWYQVEIEDEGSGIAPEVMPRIFDKFYRAPSTKTRGSGLGLAICKEIMTAMGGTIIATSPAANGRGTRVTLSFPSAPPPIEDGPLS